VTSGTEAGPASRRAAANQSDCDFASRVLVDVVTVCEQSALIMGATENAQRGDGLVASADVARHFLDKTLLPSE